jgi:Predicted endonuclease distantly related to archaeal Holliday junction resolvase
MRYFIEVKYRTSDFHGGGIAAITSKKLQQMRFAAELYDARYGTALYERLAVATIDAKGNIDFLEVE